MGSSPTFGTLEEPGNDSSFRVFSLRPTAVPSVSSQLTGNNSKIGEPPFGKPLTERNAQTRFKTAICCLGAERVGNLSIHCGRHSFVLHA